MKKFFATILASSSLFSSAYAQASAHVDLSASIQTVEARPDGQRFPNEVPNGEPQFYQMLSVNGRATVADETEIQQVEVFVTNRGEGSKRVFWQVYGNNERVRQTGFSKTAPLVCYFGNNSAQSSVAVRMQVTLRRRDEGELKSITVPVSADQFVNFEKLNLENRARANSKVCQD